MVTLTDINFDEVPQSTEWKAIINEKNIAKIIRGFSKPEYKVIRIIDDKDGEEFTCDSRDQVINKIIEWNN